MTGGAHSRRWRKGPGTPDHPSSEDHSTGHGANSAGSEPSLGIDAAKLTHQFGGDEELMREIARMFLEDGDEIMAGLGDAVAAGDPCAVEQAAHKLKSTLGMLAADAAAATACRLEYLGRRNDLSEVHHLLGELDRQVDQVRRELTALSEPRNEDAP